MKKCPYCAEEIQDEAIKCKHCGSDIVVPMQEDKQQNWAVLSHLGGLIPIAFLSFIVPLFIWLFKGAESKFVEKQSKEALNFQVSVAVYEFFGVCIAFTIIGIPITVGIFMFFWLVNLICSIKAAIRTSRQIEYTYPFNLRLIR